MTIPAPLRLDRLQLAFKTALQDALGSDCPVVWAYGEALWNSNFPQGKACDLNLIAGPSIHNQGIVQGSTPILLPTSVSVKIDSAVTDYLYFTYLNGYQYSYEAGALDTVTTIRNGLVAAINDDATGSLLTASPSGADTLIITPTNAGGLWKMSICPDNVTATPTLGAIAYQISQDTRRMTVNIQCFSKGKFPQSGAWTQGAVVEAALMSPEYAPVFATNGVGIWAKSPMVNISAIENGHWETRVSMDVECAMRNTFVTAVDIIEDIALTFTFSNPSVTDSFTIIT